MHLTSWKLILKTLFSFENEKKIKFVFSNNNPIILILENSTFLKM